MATIQSLIDQHFPSGFSLQEGEALDTLVFDETDRSGFDSRRDKIAKVTRGFLFDMAASGHLSPNTNAMGRDINWVESWNALVAGEALGPYEAMYLRGSPAMMAADKASCHRLMGLEDYGTGLREKPFTIGDAEDQLRHLLTNEMAEVSFKLGTELSMCPMTEEPLFLAWEDLYTPVVNGRGQVPCTPFVPPKPVRHVVMPMPSGRLVMADCINVLGMRAMTDRAALGSDAYKPSISAASGRDAVSERVFQDLGLLYISTTDQSPAAFVEGDIIRMGFFDEEHEAFWNDDADETRTDLSMPVASWSTCTDIWSNEFADIEVIVDIMMASGEYDTRDAAQTSLETYISQKYGAHIIDIGPGDLHIYMPTGAHEVLPDVFGAAEVEKADWRTDTYILSRTPLTVDPDIVDEPGWIAGRAKPIEQDTAPAP
jgi:hypothetical protein